MVELVPRAGRRPPARGIQSVDREAGLRRLRCSPVGLAETGWAAWREAIGEGVGRPGRRRLDGFKAVNDTRGHKAGDLCLRWIAQQLEASLRTADQLGRLGGDEFLAVLVATDSDGARHAAERMRRQLAANPWRPEDEEAGLSITLSLGLTSLQDGEDADALLSRAYEALYAAKRGGRARAVSVG